MVPHRKWSVSAIVGFILMVAFGLAVFVCGRSYFIVAFLWFFGGVLSLDGGMACIASKGRYRGIQFATIGFALFAGFVGLFISIVTLFGETLPGWADALILIGVPIGFAILAAIAILVPYFLRRNRAGMQ